jgi:anti-sigma B factor antagonist
VQVQERTEDGATVLEVEGPIDASQSDRLQQRLEDLSDHAGARVVVDLAAVTLIDSSGVGAFVSVHRRAAERESTLVLARPSEAVGRVFSLTRTDRLLRIAPSVEEALAMSSAE